ncbi:MAG: M20/M25/M40 family metallo-hydrolase [Candidatus Aminicenantes bacterium]|nr:MAG: M20/M25/M40 family metallo-hydrolase [Candidatus Aminicenantes bacterium]
MSLEVDKDKLIHWLQELIRIPSVTGNEKAVSKYVSQELQKMGYRPQVKKDNVFFEVGKGAKSLLLNAHLDTVDVGGELTHEPFEATTEKGKIFGRGASDDKGNIAAMLEVARLVKDRPVNGRLVFTFTTGEEFGTKLEAKGSYLLSQFLKAEKALVLEPQTDVEEKKVNIIYGCRGIENILVRIKGKGSHTGYPERGVNAISKAVEVLTQLEKVDFHTVNAEGQEIKTICMPIRINGGADIFLVPDKCEIMVHCRTAPEDSIIFDQVNSVCREICGDNYEIENLYSAPGYIEDPDDPLVDIIRQEAKRFNFTTQNRFAGGRIDASIFKAIGNIPSFCMGVGNREQMHLVDEYITVEEFITCSEILKNIIFAYFS